MTSILPLHPPLDALLAATEANYCAYFQHFGSLPTAEYHEDAQFTWFFGHGAPGNIILQTRLTAEGLDAQIAAMLTTLQDHLTQAEWLILPSCRPPELAARLLAQGLQRQEPRPVMIAMLDEIALDERLPSPLVIRRVSDIAMMQDWHTASMAGFEVSPAAAQPYYDAYAAQGFAEDAPLQHYVGYLGTVPVTSSTLLLAGGMAGLYDVSTIPSARQQGYGRSITLAGLRAAQQRGYHVAVLQASPAGYHLYQRLGFTTCYEEQAYEWHAKPV